MSRSLRFPSSFPNEAEERFLGLLFCPREEFAARWSEWKDTAVFERIDYATMRLLPALYLRLRDFGVRDELSGRITGVYRKVWAQNQLLLDAAGRAVRLLSGHGIDAIAFKGVALLADAYGDTGARFLGDADFIIAPEHAAEALRLLSGAGWRYDGIPFPVDGDPVEVLLALDREAAFRDERDCEIDIHWKLFDLSRGPGLGGRESRMTYAEVRSRARPFVIGGVPCYAFSPEDLLVHVIAHGAVYNQHRPFRWVVDAMQVIRAGVDWGRVLSLAQAYGFEAEVQVAVAYLVERCWLSVPEPFLEGLAALRPSRRALRRYYRASDAPSLALLGTLPLVSRAYWGFDAVGGAHKSPLGFVRYLSRAYGFRTFSAFLRFAYDKARKRIWRH